MKVCLVNTLYHPYQVGGAERSVQILAESLVNQGHQVSVITLGEEEQITQHNGVQVRRLKLSNAYWPFDGRSRGQVAKMFWHMADSYNPLMGRKIGEVLDQERPQVVHTNNVGGFSVAAWTAARARGLRLVHTIRDYYLLCYRTTMYKSDTNCATPCMDCGCLSKAKLLMASQPDCVVGISQYVLKRHQDNGFFKGTPSQVIFNAYDPPADWSPAPRTTDFTFGYVGRIAESKGLELLIGAFRQVAAERPGLRLVIAGHGDATYVDTLKQLAGGARVEFVGRVNIADYFKDIDFNVVPSLWNEPLGRVVLESYAFGVPVIAATTGALPEIVSPGETGYLFSNQQDLVRALTDASQLPATQQALLGAQCRRQAASRFSSAQITAQYLNAYTGHAPLNSR